MVAEQAINMAATSKKSASSANNSVVSDGKNLKAVGQFNKGQKVGSGRNIKIEAAATAAAKFSSAIADKVK